MLVASPTDLEFEPKSPAELRDVPAYPEVIDEPEIGQSTVDRGTIGAPRRRGPRFDGGTERKDRKCGYRSPRQAAAV